MTNILALDTATDACSVTLQRGEAVEGRHRLLPRQHNHLLFTMLDELREGVELASMDLELLAYAHGPGSFTGLRIAASAVQGLAYTLGLPVAGISTLACLAQGVLRRGAVRESETVLVMLDARINEIYWGLYCFADGLAIARVEDAVSAPADVPESLLEGEPGVVALGSGIGDVDKLPNAVRKRITRQAHDQWPDSLDLLPLAEDLRRRGLLVDAGAVQPVYLRNEIHWKKLSEQ